MAYGKAINTEVSILHVVRDLAGTGEVTGKAGSFSAGNGTDLGTYKLRAPAGAATSVTVAITEQGTTGYYDLKFTPDVLGVWHLTITNPTGTDEGTYDYDINVVQDAAGATPTGTFLTSLANLKEQLEITDASQDTYLTNLMARATQRIERLVGRTLVQATYTEYVDGQGDAFLNLKRGPIQSVTQVDSISYDSAGAETATLVAAGDYFIRGRAVDDWHLPGYLEHSGGGWPVGQRNYKVQYSAGYSTVPYDLEEACLDLCVWFKNARKDAAHRSRDTGGSVSAFQGADVLLDKLRDELWPYISTRLV